MTWEPVRAPSDAAPPAPVTVRVQSIPPRRYFPDHVHDWHQVVYAISGVLTVTTERHSFVISPEQAVWLPREDQLRELLGATFRRLERAEDGYRVVVTGAEAGAEQVHTAVSAAEAYGLALLDLVSRATDVLHP